MKSFLHDAIDVITSAASTQHPSRFVHDSQAVAQRINSVVSGFSLRRLAFIHKDPSKSVSHTNIWKFQSFGRYWQRYKGGQNDPPWVFTLIKRAWYVQG